MITNKIRSRMRVKFESTTPSEENGIKTEPKPFVHAGLPYKFPGSENLYLNILF